MLTTPAELMIGSRCVRCKLRSTILFARWPHETATLGRWPPLTMTASRGGWNDDRDIALICRSLFSSIDLRFVI